MKELRELRPVDYRIICELIRNSRLSDRQLAKVSGVSQPTVTRRRRVLEKERLLEYTAVPNMRKLGFEILALTFGRWKDSVHSDKKAAEVRAFLSKHGNIVFFSSGRSSNADRLCVSFHKTYSDYAEFMRELREEWVESVTPLDSFIVSLRSDRILRDLTFRYLADCMKEREPEAKQ